MSSIPGNGNLDARQRALKSLYERGAHLFAFHVERDPDDPTQKTYHHPHGWQTTRSTLDEVLAAEHVGLICGSLGLTCVDVDVKDGKSGADRQRLGNTRIVAVLAWAGHTDCVVRTPSNGGHLFYRADDPGRGKRIVKGVLDVALEVFGATGYVELHDPKRLEAGLDGLPVFGADLSTAQPEQMELGNGRGRAEGDRNQGTFVRVRCAVENDANPVPSIIAAYRDAVAAGLPEHEAVKAASQGCKLGMPKRDPRLDPEEASPESLEAFLPEAGEWEPVKDPVLPHTRQVEPYPGEEPKVREKVESQTDVADKLAAAWARRLRYVHGTQPGPRFDPSPFFEWHEKRGWVQSPTLRSRIASYAEEVLTTAAFRKTAEGWQKYDKHLRKEGGSAEFATGCMKFLSMRRPIGTWAGEWDTDPHLLGLPDGSVANLLAGQIEPKEGRALMRRRAPVMPDMGWKETPLVGYLAQRLPDPQVRRAQILAWAGALFAVRLTKRQTFALGPPDTWKSAFLTLVRRCLGEGESLGYSGKLPSPYLVQGQRMTEHKLDSLLTALEGCRVAVYDETPLDRKGKPAPWSQQFIGDITSDLDGISYRRMQRDAGTARGVSILGACNVMPALPQAAHTAGAVVARLNVIPWEVAGHDRQARTYLQSKEAAKAMLGMLIEAAPWAASMPDGAPVPLACRQALADYVGLSRA